MAGVFLFVREICLPQRVFIFCLKCDTVREKFGIRFDFCFDSDKLELSSKPLERKR
jgi:hypothetical protein